MNSMTLPTERYQRWKDFALRMARTCFSEEGTPPRAWVIDQVEAFLTGEIEDWEHRERIVNWDYTDGDGLEPDEYGRTPQLWCTGDKWREQEWEIEDDWRIFATAADLHWADVHDAIFGECDVIRDEVAEPWTSAPAACIRAGLDCAYEPSMGVVGFTAGDLRRMYPEGVPDWVAGTEPWKNVRFDGVVPGVGYTIGDVTPNGLFADVPDDSVVWI